MSNGDLNWIANYIWGIADDVLRDLYVRGKYREVSQALMDLFRNRSAVLVHSELLRRELMGAPQVVRDTLDQLPDEAKEWVDVSDEAASLADAYIDAGAIGRTNRADARHVALATCARADVLASWNFRHMVSRDRLRAYNEVNRRMGHVEVHILTPEEIRRAARNARSV